MCTSVRFSQFHVVRIPKMLADAETTTARQRCPPRTGEAVAEAHGHALNISGVRRKTREGKKPRRDIVVADAAS
jgi:hypothetical protein